MTKKMTNKIRMGAIVVLLFSILLGLAFAFKRIVSLADSSVTWSEITLEETYELDSKFAVPEAQVSKNGTQYDVETSISFPDGSVRTDNVVVLTMAGKYTVNYSAVIDGERYDKSASFIVHDSAYYYNKENSTVEYGTGVYQNSPTTTGLYVNLRSAETLKFSEIIDIPYVDQDIDLVTYFIAPSDLEDADFARITFTFTDVTNSNNYLRFLAQSSKPTTNDGRWGSYVQAGGNGQSMKGYFPGVGIHSDDIYGNFTTTGSFYGYEWTNTSEGVVGKLHEDPSKTAHTFKFNPVTRQVKINSKLVIDLDSEEHYGEATDVLWTGFESGKVRLSVSCDRYYKTLAGFVLTDVKDVDLSAKICEDKEGPVITVDTEYDLADMPIARVGANEYYTVPSVKAFDYFSGNVAVNTEVYKKYGTEEQEKLTITDGKFNTDELTTYTIVYTSQDAFGNETVETVEVNTVADFEDIQISLNGEAVTSGECGYKLEIPTIQVTGGSGNKKITARAYFGDVEIDLNYNGETMSFYPENAGEWTIEYTAVDYTQHELTYTYKIDVNPASAPMFRDDISKLLPKIFISGVGNQLPKVYAYDYTTGSLDKQLATVIVEDIFGETEYAAGDVFKPYVTENGEYVSVTYTYSNGDTSVTSETFKIPTVIGYNDSNQLVLENYFYKLSGVTVEKQVTENGMSFTSTVAGDHAWKYANSVIADGFSFELKIDRSKSFDTMVLKLIDANDDDKAFEIVIKRVNSSKITWSVDGMKSDEPIATSVVDGYNVVSVSIKSGKLIINEQSVSIPAELAITSSKIYLDFAVTKAVKDFNYVVDSINSYRFIPARRDLAKPNITILGKYGGVYSLGEAYEISAAASGDVLAPVTYIHVTVVDQDNEYVVAKNGVLLKDVDVSQGYEIEFTKYGKYTVTYSAAEVMSPTKNIATLSYEINVIDGEAPTFVEKKIDKENVKKGTTVTLPNIEVSDDYTAASDIRIVIIVINPYGEVSYVSNNKFFVSYAGEHTIRYTIVDEAGNESKFTYTINVVE